MRVLIVGDLHLKAKRLNDVAEAWNRAVSWAYANNVDVIAQAGDVFDKPNVFGREADVGTIYSALLDPFRDKDPLKLFLIPGNHDMGGPKEKDALTPFDEHDWITVCHRPDVVPVQKGLSICALPWVNRAQLVTKLIQKGNTPKEARKVAQEALDGLIGQLRQAVEAHRKDGQFVLFLGHLETTGARRQGGDRQTDGLFEFSPAELVSAGADAYALAHIHVRQHVSGLPNPNDGYLGTLCQLGFGEEGNESGFRYIDIEDGKITKDKFVNNKSSPRYFTTRDLSGIEYKQDRDYVKLRGETRPDQLPKKIIFEKVVPASVFKRRVEEDLDSNMPIEKLLRVWRDETKCDVPLDDLVEAANKITRKCELPGEAVGSLERIDRIMLQDVTSHESTLVDLSNTHGVYGVEGPTGAGKTTVLEAILIALYGHCPTRPQLKSLVRNRKGIKDSVIEVDFQSSGKKITARREFHKTPKTFTHNAMLYYPSKGKNDPLAGPKLDDVKTKATSLVGDLRMVLAGPFSAQAEMDNMVNLDPAQRQELWAKLLGTEKFLVMSDIAKGEAKGDNATLEAHKATIESIKVKLAGEPDDKRELKRLEKEVSDQHKIIGELDREYDEINKRVSDVKAVRDEIDRIQQRKSEIETQYRAIENENEELENQKQKLSELDEAPIQAQIDKLREKEKKVEVARRKMAEAQYKASAFSTKATKLMAEADGKRAERKNSYLAKSQEAHSKAKEIETEREDKLAQLCEKLEGIKQEQAAKKAGLEEAERRTALLGSFPDLDICKQCPLATDGIEARKSLPDIRRAIQRYQERIEKGESVIAKYKSDTKKMVSKILSLPPEEQWQPELLKEADKLEAQAKEAQKQAEQHSPPKDFQNKLATATAELELLPSLQKDLSVARRAKDEVIKIEERIQANSRRRKELESELGQLKEPDDPDDSDVKKQIAEFQTKKKMARSKFSELTMQIGQTKARLEAHDESRKTLSKLENEIAAKFKDLAAYNALAKACSRDGIPQLIVDNTIPHFQEIMSNLTSEFDGRWNVQIRSQRETTKGSVKEVIDILVDDGYGERDIKTYSGGEKQLLKTIIRIAFATLQAERSGKGLKVLILDEATYGMDPQLAESFIRMLGRLSSAFNQVFVVSHNDQVLSTLDNRIIFSVEEDVTKITMLTKEDD